jgi:hypothetical protein
MSSRIDDNQLLARLHQRALDPATRTDHSSERHAELPAPATPNVIHSVEGRLGAQQNAAKNT